MKLKTMYALNILRYLAQDYEGSDSLYNIDSVAIYSGVPYEHARKIISELKEIDVLETIRGRKGGLRLSRAPMYISTFDVIIHMEGDSIEGLLNKIDEARGDIDYYYKAYYYNMLINYYEQYIDYTLLDLAR